jgi:hypothetical protein
MKIVIEHAEVVVPRIGNAKQRRQSDSDLRTQNPQLADEIAKMFPIFPDEFAIIDLEWTDDSTGRMMCMQIPWPIAKLTLLKDRTVGTPKVHNITGVQAEDWIDYSYILKASAAFGILQTAGKIAQDAVLQTFGEDVPYDADGEQEEVEPDEGEDEGRND